MAIGTLGGLIGLGGAEFRLPVLIRVFRFEALRAVILNKAVSLVVVAAALPMRAGTIPISDVLEAWPAIVNLLSGSLIGAWVAAGWASRLRSRRLHLIMAVLLVGIALVLLFAHDVRSDSPPLEGPWQVIAGTLAGGVIGAVASLLGVAGGELLIPTFVLLFGYDLKLAGSLSLAVSLPTMLVGFFRYRRAQAFVVLGERRRFFMVMSAGSIAGVAIGSALLGLVPGSVLLPSLAAILVYSAWKIGRQGSSRSPERAPEVRVSDGE